MVRVGIIGGAGYTGGEAIRILLNHPEAELVFVHSNSNAGNRLCDVHVDLLGETDMRFTGELRTDVDALLLCVGHGDARKFLEATPLPDSVRVIDLSQDFRLSASSSIGGRRFVYGLPEMNRERIRSARNIANPGCFATCLQLGMLPLAAAGLLRSDVHVTALTGSTGAGQKLAPTSHFSQRVNNLSVYKAFTHQHLNEIGESVRSLMPSFSGEIDFVPYRGDFARGIIASIYTDCDLSEEALRGLLCRCRADLRQRPVRLPQAGRQYVQVRALGREAWGQAACRQRDRQLAQGRFGTGRAEHEPDVRPRRARGTASEAGGVLRHACPGAGRLDVRRQRRIASDGSRK